MCGHARHLIINIGLHSTRECHSPTMSIRLDNHRLRTPCTLLCSPVLLPSRMHIATLNQYNSRPRTSLYCLGNTSYHSTSILGTFHSWHEHEHVRTIPSRSTCRSSHRIRHPSPSVYCICLLGHSLNSKDFSTLTLSILLGTNRIQQRRNKDGHTRVP